jgi:hypothetical protein
MCSFFLRRQQLACTRKMEIVDALYIIAAAAFRLRVKENMWV